MPARPSKILVVEDSELLQRMYDLTLQRYRAAGATILHASHGLEALSLLNADPDVDLILLDLNMPVMDGPELLRRLARLPAFAGIPVIVVSSADEDQARARGVPGRVRGHLIKPFKTEELHALIERIWPP